MQFEGFHGRAGMGERPALVVIDVNCGFTDPASPLVCELDGVVAAIAELLAAFRAAHAAGRLHDGCLRRCRSPRGARLPRQDPGAAHARARLGLGRDRPADRAARRRGRDRQVLGLGLPRDAAPVAARERALRHARRHRRLDLGLRARDRRRRPAARVPRDRAARGGRRPQPGCARGEPVRHRHEVRRRRLARRRRARRRGG